MATTDNQILHNYLKTKIDMDGVIPDYMLPVFALQELRKQDNQLAALREAGEKMARMLKFLQLQNDAAHLESAGLWSVNGETEDQVTESIAEWEAANK